MAQIKDKITKKEQMALKSKENPHIKRNELRKNITMMRMIMKMRANKIKLIYISKQRKIIII